MASPSSICSSSSWSVLPNKMPHRRCGCSAVGLTEQNKIIVVGGSSKSSSCETFDISTQRWTSFSSSPTQRQGCPIIFHENNLYVMGGDDYHSLDGELDSVECFEFLAPAGRAPRSLPSMTSKRYGCGAVLVDDSILVVGGHDGTFDLQTVERFDTRKKTWSSLPNNMIHRRSGCVAAAVDGRVYVFGGDDGSNVLDTAEVYDTRGTTWEPLPRMPHARSHGAVVVVGHLILLLGGLDHNDKTLDTINCFDTHSRRWIMGAVPPLHVGRSRCAAVCVGAQVYVIGGRDASFHYLDTIETVSIDPYYITVPRLLTLFQKNDLLLGLWPSLIAGFPPNVIYFILSSGRCRLDSILLKPR